MQRVAPKPVDLGGLTVSRLLPTRARRLVGAWCFLDVMGPLAFDRGKPMDVPPHPHIGLQTVTWLLEGEALHKDSLGSEAVAGPGTLHLMTSGRGIAHSEETPVEHSGRLRGVQLWVALPETARHGPPSFERHSALPVVDRPGGRATVLLGTLAGVPSPATTFSPIVGAELAVEAGGTLALSLDPSFEHALLPLTDGSAAGDEALAADHLYCAEPGRTELTLTAGPRAARLMLIGGAPFREPILMWWNFVARTTEEIVAARLDWQAGRRFGEVRAYDGARLDAPAFRGRPVPANPLS